MFRNDLVVAGGKRTLRFTDVTERAGVGLRAHGMGAAVADYDNDGDLDLFIANGAVNVIEAQRGQPRPSPPSSSNGRTAGAIGFRTSAWTGS